jgi:hypothetical protein
MNKRHMPLYACNKQDIILTCIAHSKQQWKHMYLWNGIFQPKFNVDKIYYSNSFVIVKIL